MIASFRIAPCPLLALALSCALSCTTARAQQASAPAAASPIEIRQASAPQGQAAPSARVALVIGNSAYDGAPLSAAMRDASAMSATLRTRGFTVIDARDASLAQMRAALVDTRTALNGRRGIGVIFYTGHGLQLDWHNYLVPVGARIETARDVASEAMDVQEIIDAFLASGTRMNIMILDASRDGPYTKLASGRGLAQIDAPPGTFIAFAAAPGNVIEPLDTATGGLYTTSLVEEMKRPRFKLEDAFNRARRRVRLQSEGKQTPWESTSLEDDLFWDTNGQIRLEALRQPAGPSEMEDWERSRSSIYDVQGFIKRHPEGLLSAVAQIQLEQLQRASGVARPEALPQQFTVGSTRFAGNFVRDPGNTSYSGTGKVMWPNGDVYDGELVTGHRDGVGTFIWPSGQRYAGEWRHDLPNGIGTLEFVGGTRYTGAVVDGTPHGPGVYTWTDGRRLEGTWIQGIATGIGDIHFANGDVYHGAIADSLPNGNGKITYASGDRYAGNFVKGLPDGEGTCFWKNGDSFKGGWHQGLKEGRGVFTSSSGQKWEGTYLNDRRAEGDMVRAGPKPAPTVSTGLL